MFSSRAKAVFGLFSAVFAMLIGAAPAHAVPWQCVTYARHVSEIEIRGNAHTWWGQAEGRYARGSTPQVGSVMVLRSHGRMRLGHVAMVGEIVDSREIRINHANWSGRGVVESSALVRDVSANNDWSEVKVWHRPSGQLGLTEYPVAGFIYHDTPDAAPAMPQVIMASATPAPSIPPRAQAVSLASAAP